MKFPNRGLYAITQPDGKSIDQVLNEVEAVLQGGVAVVQYRDKQPIDAEFLASALLKLCHAYQVPLLINDSVELALAIGADGVHLGKDDGNVVHARRLLGRQAIIGVSCYDDLSKAQKMAELGADYVAFGRFFPSGSKPLASPAHLATLQQARLSLKVPIVAIGGILPSNGAELLAVGADLLAVIGGLFDNDPRQAANAYNALFVDNLAR